MLILFICQCTKIKDKKTWGKQERIQSFLDSECKVRIALLISQICIWIKHMSHISTFLIWEAPKVKERFHIARNQIYGWNATQIPHHGSHSQQIRQNIKMNTRTNHANSAMWFRQRPTRIETSPPRPRTAHAHHAGYSLVSSQLNPGEKYATN